MQSVGIIGGGNVQFAHNPVDDRIIVIEINPRTSRSSALASKATGFPIASVSTRLAAGLDLKDIPYWRDGSLDRYTPSGDYVVVKFARWAFEKFAQAKDRLGTQMKAVGEVMSIGRNFKEAFQKAIRSLEIGRSGLGRVKKFEKLTAEELRTRIITPNSERYFQIYEALKKGVAVDDIVKLTKITRYFIEQMAELAALEIELQKHEFDTLSDDLLIQAKRDGFSDKYLAALFNVSEKQVRDRRLALGVKAVFRAVPVSGVENAAYYYSTYAKDAKDEVAVTPNKKIMILGGGPNRIGQGIEFDYCSVHSVWALREMGIEAIIINNNPETVSTDFDISDRLYFEPLTTEDVLNIIDKEKPEGVIVQFGGQTAINLAASLQKAGVKVFGTSVDDIDRAEDRERFDEVLTQTQIPRPQGISVTNLDDAVTGAAKIGYPVMVRPSYVLGGRAMEIVANETMLRRYLSNRILKRCTPRIGIHCFTDGHCLVWT